MLMYFRQGNPGKPNRLMYTTTCTTCTTCILNSKVPLTDSKSYSKITNIVSKKTNSEDSGTHVFKGKIS